MTTRSSPLGPLRRQRAVALLRERTGGDVEVVGEEPLGGSWAPVTRLRLRSQDPTLSSVVVKTRRTGPPAGPWSLTTEHAGLVAAAGGGGVTPSVLAADLGAGVLVLEDMGSLPTLESLLLGGDRVKAASAFVALGRALRRLHDATADPVAAGAFGPWAGIEAWEDVAGALRRWTLPVPAAAALADVDLVVASLRRPGAAGGLVHGDVQPANVLVGDDGECRLVDLELASAGHTGVDAAALVYPFPNYSPHWATVPAEVSAAAVAAYGRLDDRQLAVGAAAALVVRLQRLDRIAADDQPATERWRRRAQMVQQLRVFEALAASTGALVPFGRWAGSLAGAMSDRWADATEPPPPRYAAFIGA